MQDNEKKSKTGKEFTDIVVTKAGIGLIRLCRLMMAYVNSRESSATNLKQLTLQGIPRSLIYDRLAG